MLIRSAIVPAAAGLHYLARGLLVGLFVIGFASAQSNAATASSAALKSEDSQGTASVNNTNANNFPNAAQLPSQHNPLLADNGDVRIAKMIGSSVYNTDDKKLGHVEDVLMGQTGQPQVVVQVDGSSKKVEVPWNKMVFGDAKKNPDNTVLMSGVTKKALDELPAYKDKETKNG